MEVAVLQCVFKFRYVLSLNIIVVDVREFRIICVSVQVKQRIQFRFDRACGGAFAHTIFFLEPLSYDVGVCVCVCVYYSQ